MSATRGRLGSNDVKNSLKLSTYISSTFVEVSFFPSKETFRIQFSAKIKFNLIEIAFFLFNYFLQSVTDLVVLVLSFQFFLAEIFEGGKFLKEA